MSDERPSSARLRASRDAMFIATTDELAALGSLAGLDPAELGLEHVLLPPSGGCRERYLALDLALVREPARELAGLDDDALERALAERGLNETARSGDDESAVVFVVPDRLVAKLAAAPPARLGIELAEWNARSPWPNTARDLAKIWALACAAVAEKKRMFLRCLKRQP